MSYQMPIEYKSPGLLYLQTFERMSPSYASIEERTLAYERAL